MRKYADEAVLDRDDWVMEISKVDPQLSVEGEIELHFFINLKRVKHTRIIWLKVLVKLI